MVENKQKIRGLAKKYGCAIMYLKSSIRAQDLLRGPALFATVSGPFTFGNLTFLGLSDTVAQLC